MLRRKADNHETGTRASGLSALLLFDPDIVFQALEKLTVNQLRFIKWVSPKAPIKKLGLRSKTGAFKRTVSELLNDSSIKYTVPDKPTSRLQKYRLTEKGRKLLENQ